MADKVLLDVRAAADRLSLGRSKLYEEMAAGRIESVRVGRRRLIPIDALRAYVERLRSTECGDEP